MDCPVCGRRSDTMLCPECGFDGSRDYERYPTLGAVGKAPSVSALGKQWQRREITDEPEKKPQKKRPWIGVVACALALVLGIGIGIGVGGGKPNPTEPDENPQMQAPPETTDQTAPPETTEPQITYLPGEEPWRDNILRSDEIPNDQLEYSASYPVFDSKYARRQIVSVTFLNTLSDAPEDAWDVSASGDGKVLAWVVPNEGLYDLYIGAEGGVSAGESCLDLFHGYTNVRQFYFADAFHTENIKTMDYMFRECASLTSLDLSSFDTSNVQSMYWVFGYCSSLTNLDLRNFDTSNVESMMSMFYGCEALSSLDLSTFDTSNVENMSCMFIGCSSLTSLDLSSFDTSNAQFMGDMFADCSSLTDLTLDLSTFNTNSVLLFPDNYESYMFNNCPAGSDWAHLLK